MAYPSPDPVFNAPLRVTRGAGGRVVVSGPDGHRISLSRDAARRSLSELAAMLEGPDLVEVTAGASVARLPRKGGSRPLWLRARNLMSGVGRMRRNTRLSLRGVVSLLLAPVAFSVLAGSVLLLLLLAFSQDMAQSWWPAILVGSIFAAPFVAYRVAPLILDVDERAPHRVYRPRPVLVASND